MIYKENLDSWEMMNDYNLVGTRVSDEVAKEMGKLKSVEIKKNLLFGNY